MYLELIAIVLTTLFVWDYMRNRRHNVMYAAAGIRGPRSYPFVGSAPILINESPKTVFDLQFRLIAQYGKNVKINMMGERGFMTADPKMIEAIMSSQQTIQKNNLYGLLVNWLGDGLLLSKGKKWFRRRKIITPAFHFKILEDFVEVFDQQSAVMVQQLYDRADGKTVINMFPVACLCAMDIIAETAMGVKIDAQLQPQFSYVQSVTTASGMLAERLMNPLQRTDSLMKILYPKLFTKLDDSVKNMHNFTNSVITERRDLLQKSLADGGNATADHVNDVGQKRRMALLDVLLQSTIDGAPLSNEDIREEVDTFMFEGHDTTTSSIAFTLYLLARHPEVQARAFQEIRDVLGDDKSTPVTMQQLGELKYLECVIKESLRLFPSVPLIGRHITQDTVLDGKLIPAHSDVLILIYHAQRDPEYFPDPEKFLPERFSLERKGEINPFAYTPFSAGPRNCIGQKFAMLEIKSTISKMLRHFELLPLGEDVQLVLNLILRSTTGINCGIKPRVY
ncbi:probable cytochrome P450 4d14 isoform X1 [Drosophila biarmipes]|uniref:probable cytochrome P450 4d14 isoform X1 n=2 Tax=Drosophila biarmipes TaxID=125945 RepID=UPI001CDA9198|nr:probable cytochrome P450 4d14 isoform X1 [Drosophila biarmipes]